MIDWSQVVTKEQAEKHKDTITRLEARNGKKKEIDGISVEVDGLVFDGDELSQSRMIRVANSISDAEEVRWVLADNRIESVTRRQLLEAARLSAIKMSSIWVNGNE